MAITEIGSTVWKGVVGLPRRVLGSRNDRLLKSYQRLVGPIGALEPQLRGDYDERFAKRRDEANIDQLPQ